MLKFEVPYDVFLGTAPLPSGGMEPFLAKCRQMIEAGGTVVFFSDYVNAKREVNAIWKTQAEVDEWEARMVEGEGRKGQSDGGETPKPDDKKDEGVIDAEVVDERKG